MQAGLSMTSRRAGYLKSALERGGVQVSDETRLVQRHCTCQDDILGALGHQLARFGWASGGINARQVRSINTELQRRCQVKPLDRYWGLARLVQLQEIAECEATAGL